MSEVKFQSVSSQEPFPGTFRAFLDRLGQLIYLDVAPGEYYVTKKAGDPTSSKEVRLQINASGALDGIRVQHGGQWRYVTPEVGLIAFRPGRPSQYDNGKNGWYIANGENGTNDLQAYWIRTDSNRGYGSIEDAIEKMLHTRSTLSTALADIGDLSDGVTADAAGNRTVIDGILSRLASVVESIDDRDEEPVCDCDSDDSKVEFFYVQYMGIK